MRSCTFKEIMQISAWFFLLCVSDNPICPYIFQSRRYLIMIYAVYAIMHILRNYLLDFSYFEYHIQIIQNGVGVLSKVKGILHEASRQPTMGPRGNRHGPRGKPQWSVQVALRSYLRLPRCPCGLPWGPIAGCLEVSCAGRLEVPGNKLWDKNCQF